MFRSNSDVMNVSMHSNTCKSSLLLSKLLQRFLSLGQDGSFKRFGLGVLKKKEIFVNW